MIWDIQGPILIFLKKNFLFSILNKLKYKFDYLLIRGHTPLQIFVWMNLKVRKDKIFYLVRSIKQGREISLLKPISIVGFFQIKLENIALI